MPPPLRALLTAALLLLLTGPPARAIGRIGGDRLPETRIGSLVFLDAPQAPLPGSWTRAGLDLGSLDPHTMTRALEAAGPLGRAVLDAVDRAGYRRILVVFLTSRTIPSPVRSRMRQLGFGQTRIDYGHSTLASWQSAGAVGLVLLRVDRIAAKRRRGFPSTPAGSLAHELVHVAQSAWGALPRGRRGGAFGDVWDEAEAYLVTQLVERAEVLRKGGGILNEGETRLLGGAPAPTRGNLARIAESLGRGPYRDLPMGPLRDPKRYHPSRDPFAGLPP